MLDIHATRRCPHGKLFDDYCEPCEQADHEESKRERNIMKHYAERDILSQGRFYMDIVNEHFSKHTDWPRPAIECADGFHISVQAHYGAYCQPRPNRWDEAPFLGPFFKVEYGFPSGPVPELVKWKDGEGRDEECVYGYVPVNVVVALIESHGGVATATDDRAAP